MLLNSRRHLDELVQEKRNSSAIAMELHLSCINSSIYIFIGEGHDANLTWISAKCWKGEILVSYIFYSLKWCIPPQFCLRKKGLFIWVRSWNWGCLVTWFCYQLIAKPGNKKASPREPHALAWGPSSFHTKIFRVERTRLKTVEKITNSL